MVTGGKETTAPRVRMEVSEGETHPRTTKNRRLRNKRERFTRQTRKVWGCGYHADKGKSMT